MADGVNRENRMRLPLKLRAEPSGGKSASEEKGKEPQTPEEMWDRLSKTLERNINMVGAARASREFMVSPGMGRGEGGLCRRIPRR